MEGLADVWVVLVPLLCPTTAVMSLDFHQWEHVQQYVEALLVVVHTRDQF